MKIWNFIFCLCLFSIGYAAFESRCVTPPLKCPNNNVTFWLYTRANEKNPVELKISNSSSITLAPWVAGAAVKILIHGYTGHRDFSPNTEIRPEYMKCCNYNIISVDYHNIVLEPCYLQAPHNTELAGMCTAQLIDELVQTHGFSLSSFHVIGFSLGGQTAGYIANHLKSGKLSRITALDPALPLFATNDKHRKIDPSDAHFVDVFHTNALQKGKLELCGHLDCFANGGTYQPGCVTTETQTKSGCNHNRAPQYFAESITTNRSFYAYKCSSWMTYMLGFCGTSGETVKCGEYASKNSSGVYFFSTNSAPPYGRG